MAPSPPAPKAPPPLPLPHDFTQSAAQVEYESGVKVIRANGGMPPDSMIIEVPQAHGLALASAPDPRLVEKSRYGLLPRVGDDGARPADVYARPLETSSALKAGAPRIVLVVGGLGLSRPITEAAIQNLPGGVTFGFAPYGRDLAESVARARANGHEVILQAPMEPLDYPQTDPGPHTLLTNATPAENTDNLHWLMSRFSGYVGIGNFLGAKFTADPASFAPVLQEIGERGLIYLDDGTSPQSLTASLAAQSGVPAVKADLVLDTTPDGIDAALVKLEAIARDKGLAIGVASALPEVRQDRPLRPHRPVPRAGARSAERGGEPGRAERRRSRPVKQPSRQESHERVFGLSSVRRHHASQPAGPCLHRPASSPPPRTFRF